MAIISDELNKILSAVFGKDVRRALHDGLGAINKETESTTARQNYLDRKYDEQIKNMTLQDPSSAEIVDMRVAANGKTFKKAGDRLNYFDEQLSIVATEYYLHKFTTLKKIIDSMDERGGTVIVPKGTFYVEEDIYLTKPVTIKGYGETSILVINSTISTDDNPLNFLKLDNFKVVVESSNTAFFIDKRITGTIYDGNPTLNADLIIDNMKFYTETVDGGNFIKIKQVSNSSIINSLFQHKNINSENYNAINIESDVKLGIRNLTIENCKFLGLNYAIRAIGNEKWYTHTCGLMIKNTLIMDCNYGVYAENLDWVTFEDGMIDYTDFPIKALNVSNLKVKNNYLFSRRKEVSSACAEYVVTNTKTRIMPEIVGNHMWNSSYGSLNPGVITTGVLIKTLSTNVDTELSGTIIAKNTIHRVTRGISLIAEASGGYSSKIKYANIEGNNIYMTNRGIFSTGQIENSIAPNNTFNTIVKAIESESDIPLSNILTRRFTINIRGSRYGEMATGIPFKNIISVNLLYNDNVFTFKANAFLKPNSDVVAVATGDQTPGERDYTFTVEVKYTPSW